MFYILYGMKADDKYYISSIDPILWSSSSNEARRYENRYSAEYDVLRNYDNYHFFKNNIKSGNIDSVFIARITFDLELGNVIEDWRLQLL